MVTSYKAQSGYLSLHDGTYFACTNDGEDYAFKTTARMGWQDVVSRDIVDYGRH